MPPSLLSVRRISSTLTDRLKRIPRHSVLRPLPIFLVAACLQMFAFLSPRMTEHWEINAFVAGVVEARNAMLEGQFPVRVTPIQNAGTRYPMFQFYANLPYTASALPTLLPGVGPYAGWRAMMFAILLLGGVYTFRTTLRLTRHPAAAGWAGAIFLTAPYLFTDIRGRGAVSEAVAFNLMPAAIYYTLRCVQSRRWRFIPACAIAWTGVALSHNITYLYGVVFVGLLALSYLWTRWPDDSQCEKPRLDTGLGRASSPSGAVIPPADAGGTPAPQHAAKRDVSVTGASPTPAGLAASAGSVEPSERADSVLRRIARLLLAGALHTSLVLWYFLPQTLVMKDLGITATVGESPVQLTTLPLLLWPIQRTPDGSTTPRLGLQVGWPILLAVLAALPLLFASARRNPLRGAMLRFLALFSLAFFLVWSPADVWAYLPKEFHYIQFTYRLLVFVAVFGALLAGCVLAVVFRRGISLPASAVIAVLLLASSATYVARLPRLGRGYERRMVNKPKMGGRTDYLLSTVRTTRTGWTHPDANLADYAFGLADEDGQVKERGVAWLPVPPGGTALVLHGDVPQVPAGALTKVSVSTPTKITFGADGRIAEGSFPPGPFYLRVPVRPGDRNAIEASVDVSGGGEIPVRVNLTSLRWEGAADSEVHLVAPADLRPLMHLGRVSRCAVSLNRSSLVAIPVLDYPKLVSVRVNGVETAHGNVGRFVALQLPPGEHRIDVRFVGVPWANAAGAAGLAVLTLFAVGGTWHFARGKWRRRFPIAIAKPIPRLNRAVDGAGAGGVPSE